MFTFNGTVHTFAVWVRRVPGVAGADGPAAGAGRHHPQSARPLPPPRPTPLPALPQQAGRVSILYQHWPRNFLIVENVVFRPFSSFCRFRICRTCDRDVFYSNESLCVIFGSFSAIAKFVLPSAVQKNPFLYFCLGENYQNDREAGTQKTPFPLSESLLS